MKRSKIILQAVTLTLLICVVFSVRKFRAAATTTVLMEPQKTKGPLAAPVYIVLFSDFACPFCDEIRESLDKVLMTYPADLKLLFKHYPLAMHPAARPAAEASECAADQNAFWPFHDQLFSKVEEWNDLDKPQETFIAYATTLGLNTTAFRACLESGVKKNVVEQNMAEAKKYFIQGTPTCIINGRKILARHDPDYIIELIKNELDRMKTGESK